MKVTLFGATGKTGQYLIAEGLKRGIQLTVFARTTTSFDSPNVHVVRGSLDDKDCLAKAIRGADAVLSALGPTSPKHPGNLPITKATESIISVMKQENVTRLIAVSTGTAPDPRDGSDWKIWLPALFIKIAMPSTFKDILALAKEIRASGLDWTMVRVALLKNRPASQRLNVGLYGHSAHSMTISREDVAIFMFDQISDKKYIKQAPGISTQLRPDA
ncbi:NAD(P)-dependent oxidoreductase [Pseudomonas corrugata]|uniref:NAD(P)-dependent oxidoreductase n=1 Tax=Pseudomonas corrugata TaxID=47879 RepID=UPI001586609A|nr:NAD(P)H-binding protein [Pseudomonas corrugata]MCI0997743.1 NAD(P)H-binding protein [Pseudomonas corrugata]NUT64676.1 NAD(P)H-binding protein [Pseudomonas corrugata]